MVMEFVLPGPLELACLRWLSRGKTLAEIALLQGKTVSEIAHHVERALAALNAKSAQEALAKAHLSNGN